LHHIWGEVFERCNDGRSATTCRSTVRIMTPSRYLRAPMKSMIGCNERARVKAPTSVLRLLCSTLSLRAPSPSSSCRSREPNSTSSPRSTPRSCSRPPKDTTWTHSSWIRSSWMPIPWNLGRSCVPAIRKNRDGLQYAIGALALGLLSRTAVKPPVRKFRQLRQRSEIFVLRLAA